MKENMSLEPILSLQTSQDVDKCVDCPLCMEALDFDDLGFFPCSCGYQVCRFCWNRLKNDDNGLCPACRQAYPDSPIQFSQISIEAVEELKKRKKKQKEKQKFKDAAKSQNLSSVRVVQKNLLFVIGLPQRLSQDDLRKEFSKYGKIVKMVINASSAYVTYARPEDAVAAIKSLNEANQSSEKKNQRNAGNNQTQTLRASLGTTKYCTHWLRSQNCPKQPDCMYLHDIADPEASFTKEEMQVGKHTEYEKRLIQHYLDLLAKEKDAKNNRKNTNNSHNVDDKQIESKTILIQNRLDSQTNQKQFQSNHSSNAFGGDETSNDSVANGESSDTMGISASPVIPFRWGTPINSRLSSNCSSNSESNSLSSTPNQTSVALSSQQTTAQPQHPTAPTITQPVGQTFGIKTGDMLDNIDDNAVDTHMLTNGIPNGLLDGEDSSGEDITADDEPEDDGLDFDPISISSRGLQDLLRDTTQTTECLMNNVFNTNSNNDYMFSNGLSNNGTLLQNLQNQRQNQNYIQNLTQNQMQNNLSYLSKQQQLVSNGYANHGQQQQSVLQRSLSGQVSATPVSQSPHPHQNQWQQQTQQQQNCLRQLLPNVNITFQHQSVQSLQSSGGSKPMSALVGNGYLNGLTQVSNPSAQTSQPVIANSHIRQQQTIGHQMGGQSVMGQTVNTGLQHLWPQREQQKREHMYRMEQQFQRQPPQHQFHSQRLYMSGQHMSGPMSGPQLPLVRPPPPGF